MGLTDVCSITWLDQHFYGISLVNRCPSLSRCITLFRNDNVIPMTRHRLALHGLVAEHTTISYKPLMRTINQVGYCTVQLAGVINNTRL